MSSSVDANNNNSTEAMSSATPGAGAAGALGAINTNTNNGSRFKRQKTAAADDFTPTTTTTTTTTTESSSSPMTAEAVSLLSPVNFDPYQHSLIPLPFRLSNPQRSMMRAFGDEASNYEFDASILRHVLETGDLELKFTSIFDGIPVGDLMNQLYLLAKEKHLLLEHVASRNTCYNGGPQFSHHVERTLSDIPAFKALIGVLRTVFVIRSIYSGAYGESFEDVLEELEEEDQIPEIAEEEKDEQIPELVECKAKVGEGFIPFHQDSSYGRGDAHATHRILFNIGCIDKELWFKRGKKVCGLKITHGSVVSLSERAGGVVGDLSHAAFKGGKSWVIAVEVVKKE